ncbi:hypothetical protein BZZ01_26640 [Nostocales cyanobacterium HT-58-2]|nr:hypothetical protein BZZ01_26640 [Nostocales cyanobacterium HT-58-2]
MTAFQRQMLHLGSQRVAEPVLQEVRPALQEGSQSVAERSCKEGFPPGKLRRVPPVVQNSVSARRRNWHFPSAGDWRKRKAHAFGERGAYPHRFTRTPNGEASYALASPTGEGVSLRRYLVSPVLQEVRQRCRRVSLRRELA